MKDEALRLALEFLESGNFVYPTSLSTAIKEALAQEPASVTCKEVADAMNELRKGTFEQRQVADEMENKRLYTTPPAAVMGIPTTGDYAMGYAEGFNDACKRPAQEPDIYPEEARDMGLEALAYYTTPPAAQPAPVQEPHNFCPRCGKRLEGVLGRPQMHTCTPPLWGHT